MKDLLTALAQWPLLLMLLFLHCKLHWGEYVCDRPQWQPSTGNSNFIYLNTVFLFTTYKQKYIKHLYIIISYLKQDSQKLKQKSLFSVSKEPYALIVWLTGSSKTLKGFVLLLNYNSTAYSQFMIYLYITKLIFISPVFTSNLYTQTCLTNQISLHAESKTD